MALLVPYHLICQVEISFKNSTLVIIPCGYGLIYLFLDRQVHIEASCSYLVYTPKQVALGTMLHLLLSYLAPAHCRHGLTTLTFYTNSYVDLWIFSVGCGNEMEHLRLLFEDLTGILLR